MTEKFICIHGHFYQPPRENPWLEFIELQDSAYPYHDWNERVTAECYAPNASSRILDEKGLIAEITNNYGKISFNFGPTLLWWLKESEPEVYQSILNADQESQKSFSGHGSALAQVYNHLIMPLANRRDKITQVTWGIKDFESRYGRKPEGMWLAETAVDVETLEILASCGIKFTILEPQQAQRVRSDEKSPWKDLKPGQIDTTRPYEVVLPSGNHLACFFYNGPISRAVAFENLLDRGEVFADRLLGAFPKTQDKSCLVHIATDGETYGHHHHFGDMALAYALRTIEKHPEVQLTNYGEYLEKFPPRQQVEIRENTSWSCSHGIERWRSDCGCTTDGRAGWNQAWRKPLRESLDWLRDNLAEPFENKTKNFFADPWTARNDYIQVILDRSPENVDRFFARHASRDLQDSEKITVLKLMELQRHALLMYTSCGWFFEELSRIETVQIIQYAGRALQLAKEVMDVDLEEGFLKILEQARSNIPQLGTGRDIYQKFVKPAIVDLTKLSAHYAISSLFEEFSKKERIYCYLVDRELQEGMEAGKVKYRLGRARFTSLITGESALISYGAIHLGDHQVHGGVRHFQGEDFFQKMKEEIQEAYSRGNFAEIIRSMDKHFGASTYSIRSLFIDEQRKVLDNILEATLEEIEMLHAQVYDQRAALIQFLADTDSGVPKILKRISEDVLNFRLRQAFQKENIPYKEVRTLLQKAEKGEIPLDQKGLGYTLQKAVEKLMKNLHKDPEREENLQRLLEGSALLKEAPLEVNFWKIQNWFFEMSRTVYLQMKQQAKGDHENAKAWVKTFQKIGANLGIRVP